MLFGSTPNFGAGGYKPVAKKPLFSPAQIIVLGYILIILFGALLLSLPFSQKSGAFGNFFDELFCSTSTVSLTGLLLSPAGENYSVFGQVVLLLLIQIGGLGFMTITTLFFSLLGKNISIQSNMLTRDAIGESTLSGLSDLIKRVVTMTFVLEAAGFLLLLPVFIPMFGGGNGVFYSLFHAVSAFCNAGLDILPAGGFAEIAGNGWLVFVMSALIILGGFGYIVIFELISYRRGKRLGLYAKVVLIGSLGLVLAGTLVYFFAESNNPETFGGMPFFERITRAFFLGANDRTAGFSAIDMSNATTVSKAFSAFSFIIGGSPASTAGGIKTTTAFLIFMQFLCTLKGKKYITVGRHTISEKTAGRAEALLFATLLLMFSAGFILAISESQSLEVLIYEAASALSNSGMSMGGVASMTPFGKTVLALLMLFGRVGIMTVFLIFMNTARADTEIKYSETKFLIG